MKHIFTVHSSLTFLVAYSIVDYLALKDDEVIFISSNYKVPVKRFKVYRTFAEQNKSTYRKLVTWNVPRSFDIYLENIIKGDEFVAYIDLMSMYQRILITHQNCLRFHFFEEGNSAYMTEDDINDLTWEGLFRGVSFRESGYFKFSFYQSLIRVLRGYNYRLLQMPYHYMAYVNFHELKYFCFSNNAFFNAPQSKKIFVKPNPEDRLIQDLAKGISLENEIIWIDGSNARFTGLEETVYYKAIDKAVEILKGKLENNQIVYIKLRPGLTEELVKNTYLVKSISSNGISWKLLPEDINLECLFVLSRNCKVIGVLTAALEYAHVFGHQAISIYDLFERQPKTFFDRMHGFMANLGSLKSASSE